VVLLADSIGLNFEKGSPLELAFNRRAFDALASAASQTHGQGSERVRSALAEAGHHLEQAESMLGRLVLPGETG
jgi:hypothetical protein